MMVDDAETACWGFWQGVNLAPVDPLSLQRESHTKQDQDFKIMDYLSSCKWHKNYR